MKTKNKKTNRKLMLIAEVCIVKKLAKQDTSNMFMLKQGKAIHTIKFVKGKPEYSFTGIRSNRAKDRTAVNRWMFESITSTYFEIVCPNLT